MRLYLDCCCYNRPFDDLSQPRVNLESNAILLFIGLALSGVCTVLGSKILDMEIDEIGDERKKFKVKKLYEAANVFVPHTEKIEELAENICNSTSIKFMDSLHLASAEFGKADVFLTTDDKLIRMCKNIQIHARVMNPAIFLEELIIGGKFQP